MKRLSLFTITALLALSSVAIMSALAQSETAWDQPANLSRSGAASLPLMTIAADGTRHAIWWDSLNGTQYARGTAGVTQTTWARTVAVASLWGSRQVVTNTQTGKVTVSLAPPRDTRLIAGTGGNIYALWLDSLGQLQAIQNRGPAWADTATVLADAAIALDVAADISGTLHLAYLRANETANAPAGIYYRSTSGGEWNAPALVYASPYFRVRKFEDSHLSVAGTGTGLRIVVWDDARLGQSFYSISTNNGQNFSNPQPVTGNETESAAQANVIAGHTSELLLLWQDPTRPGCSLSQRRSADGGKNWSAPERVLTSLTQCPGDWNWTIGGDKRVWLTGISQASNTGNNPLAAWDGQVWSDVVQVNARFRDPSTNKTLSLSCLNLALAGQQLYAIGCDGNGDIWAVQNNIELGQLLPALKPAWQSPSPLGDKANPGRFESLPVVAADAGKFFAMWSQSSAETANGVALYISSSDGAAWSRATLVLKSPTDAASNGNGPGTGGIAKAEEPALAADRQSRLHAVWSGGTSGQVLYSWAYVRDATTSSGWSAPLALPSIARAGSWPDLTADPRGETLHVVYAIPYNEERGIYYVRSDDGGNTWAKPVVVLDAITPQWPGADKPRLAIDSRANILHAVWLRTNLPNGTGPQAVYYARSTDNGQTWSAPVRVAEGLVDWPRIAAIGTNQVLLVWNQARSGNPNAPAIEVWSQFSSTGGDRWSTASRVGGLGEVSGPVGLASDGTQAFLVGVGQGLGEAALVHARWNGTVWEAQDKMGLGQNYAPGNAAAAAMAADTGRLGAILLAQTKQANGTIQLEAWATQRNVSGMPSAAPIPTFTPLPTMTPIPTSTPRPTPTVKPQLPAQPETHGTQSDLLKGQSPLILSGGLAAMIVIGALAMRAVLIARRR